MPSPLFGQESHLHHLKHLFRVFENRETQLNYFVSKSITSCQNPNFVEMGIKFKILNIPKAALFFQNTLLPLLAQFHMKSVSLLLLVIYALKQSQPIF